MNIEEFRELLRIAKVRDEKYYAWIRQLVVLASAALTALVTFRAGAQSVGLALLALRVAWVFFGLSIVLGAACLRGEVAGHQDYIQAAIKEAWEQQKQGKLWTLPTFVPKRWVFRCAEFLFPVALLVTVMSLVVHALLRS